MTATQAPPTYSSADVCDRAGISYRQLDYWARVGYLRPEWTYGNNPGGSGNIRRWPAIELIKASTMARLIREGWSIQAAGQLVQADPDRARMMARLVALGVSAQQAARIARDPSCRWRWLADVMAACKAMEP